MRYLKNSEQLVNRKGKPVGMWKHGKKGGYAVCPRCLTKIIPGQWVKAAPGHAGTIRHVKCGGR